MLELQTLYRISGGIKIMSCHENEALLESLFEDGLEKGMSDAEAESYARERLDQLAVE